MTELAGFASVRHPGVADLSGPIGRGVKFVYFVAAPGVGHAGPHGSYREGSGTLHGREWVAVLDDWEMEYFIAPGTSEEQRIGILWGSVASHGPVNLRWREQLRADIRAYLATRTPGVPLLSCGGYSISCLLDDSNDIY